MKKIIALLLLIACTFALFACGEPEEPEDLRTDLEKVVDMYKISAPTKVVTNTEYNINDRVLHSVDTLVTGRIGTDAATVYTYAYEQMAEVEDDSTGLITTITGSKEYLESKGVRVDGKKWDPDGEDFAPTPGSIAINLDPTIITDYTYEDHKLSFVVAEEDTATVFGEDNEILAEVTVEITDDGALITGITLTYTLPKNSKVGATDVTVETKYWYDLQQVTLTK